MDEMRKAFEAWAAEFGVACEHEDFAWTVWQAATTLAERERVEPEGQRMAQIEAQQSETLRRIEAIEKAQANYYRNEQRLPGPFGRLRN